MATQYTNLLKLALPTDGELDGTWGDVVNNNITSMIEEAVAGMTTINSWTANAASIGSPANGTTSPGRAAIIKLTDTGVALTGNATLTLATTPANKTYIISNQTGKDVKVTRGSATNFVVVPDNSTATVMCDGNNVYSATPKIGGWNPAVAYDLTGDGSVTTFDSTTYNFFSIGLSYSTYDPEPNFNGLEASWDAISGTILTNNKFRVFPARGNFTDATSVRTGGSSKGYGDTTWIGNADLNGTSSKLTSGMVVDAAKVSILVNPDAGAYTALQCYFQASAGTPTLNFGTGHGQFLYVSEDSYSLTGTSINPANGGFQYKTITANTTFTKSLADGSSVLLRIIDGDLYTITWPTGTSWVGPNGNTPPTLTGNDVVMFFKVSTIDHAVYLGSYA